MGVFTGELNSGGEGGIRTPVGGFSPQNGLANRRIQPLCHLSAVYFQQLTTESAIFWWPSGALTGDRGGKLTPVELSPTMASPNFNSNSCRSPFACLNSSIRACTFATASSTV